MRKFIVSDLHGSGEVYNPIIGYLENIALIEDVELYINGDLIDRGLESFTMLEDVYERIHGKGNIKINYLAGNHEWLMYQALRDLDEKDMVRMNSLWLYNGGSIIEGELDTREDGLELCQKYEKFLKNLDIYHKFDEEINGDKLLLVHAKAPDIVKDVCHLKLGDDESEISDLLWTRREQKIALVFGYGDVVGYNDRGKKGYLAIIGHTPVKNNRGFNHLEEENVFNIDGGCNYYANSCFYYNKVPLVEIKDGSLEFIIFNHNNEIVDGYSYDGILTKKDNLEKERIFIDHSYDNNEEEAKMKIKDYLE